MTFTNAILAGVTLVRDAIQSENFVTGVSGWRISRDGDAEFNDVDIRGELEVVGTDPDSKIKVHVDASGDPVIQFYDDNGVETLRLDGGPGGSHITAFDTSGDTKNAYQLSGDAMTLRMGKSTAGEANVVLGRDHVEANTGASGNTTLKLNPTGGDVTVNGNTAADKVTIGAGAITADELDLNPSNSKAVTVGLRDIVVNGGKANLPSTAGITAETAIGTLTVGDLVATDEVELMVCLALRTLTAGDQYTFRVRRGNGLAGAVVHTAVSDKTVGTNTNKYTHGPIFDTPGAVSGQQYTVSIARFAGAGTITAGDAESFVRAHVVRS